MIEGSLLKHYREKENLTIKELSKKIHVRKNTIIKWENNELKPTEYDIENICKLYNIKKEDLIIKQNVKKNILISFLLLICGLAIGIILNDLAITIILPIILVIILNAMLIIKSKYLESRALDGPKSLFGIFLDNNKRKDRYKYYILESLILSSGYILINIICKILDFTNFLINIYFTTNESLNFLLVWLITFVLLTFLAFLIELIFGEFMIKKYYGGNS